MYRGKTGHKIFNRITPSTTVELSLVLKESSLRLKNLGDLNQSLVLSKDHLFRHTLSVDRLVLPFTKRKSLTETFHIEDGFPETRTHTL